MAERVIIKLYNKKMLYVKLYGNKRLIGSTMYWEPDLKIFHI